MSTRRDSKDREKAGTVSVDAESAALRPPLLPSHFNASSPSPQTSQKRQREERRKSKESSSSGLLNISSESSAGSERSTKKAFAASTLSPSHQLSNPGGLRRSPRTRVNGVSPSTSRQSPGNVMNIDHLLSNTSRSPWSPGFFTARMPNFTNAFSNAGGVQRPTSNKLLSNGRSSNSLAGAPPQATPMEGKASLPIRRTLDGAFENTAGSAATQPDEGEHEGRSGALGHLPVQLFVAAVGDGEISGDVAPKARDLLEQVVRKVSKEQNTVVNVKGEGPLHIQLRVFAYRSVEAQALKDYILSHAEQVPCPFILLSKALPMAVAYDTAAIDPSNANVADRLRKQAKTRAIKLLREVILDKESGVTAAMLRGRHGPLEPERRLVKLIMSRAQHLDGISNATESKYIAFPAVRRHGDAASTEPHPAPALLARRSEQAHRSQGSQRKGGSHFPVSLTVIALGEGLIARNTQPKLQHRLRQLVDKVPKEHRCSVELPREGAVALNMRLFVANSEDAKAAREYVVANAAQRPAPFVILSEALPIAVSYDARTLDVSDANVVDCLRKQAKTRAVKLIKETIADPAVGVTLRHLRGHEGSRAVAALLDAPLMHHATSFGDKKYIAFAARKRQLSESAMGRETEEALAGLQSLASAAMHSSAAGPDSDDDDDSDSGGRPMMSQQRVCEMCKTSNDGSYGTGRFCSKVCRYEAHALRVAHQRRIQGAVGPPAEPPQTETARAHKAAPAGGKADARRKKRVKDEEETVDDDDDDDDDDHLAHSTAEVKAEKGKRIAVKKEEPEDLKEEPENPQVGTGKRARTVKEEEVESEEHGKKRRR